MVFRTSGLLKASRTLSATVFLKAGAFCEVPKSVRSPTELRLLICRVDCLSVAGRVSGLSGCYRLLGPYSRSIRYLTDPLS